MRTKHGVGPGKPATTVQPFDAESAPDTMPLSDMETVMGAKRESSQEYRLKRWGSISFAILVLGCGIDAGDDPGSATLPEKESQPSELSGLLEGDWHIYSHQNETPHISHSDQFLTFKKTGDNTYEIYEACSQRAHSTGTVRGGILDFDGTETDAVFKNGRLVLTEMQGNAAVGRTFVGEPVNSLVCSNEDSGRSKVRRQALTSRAPNTVRGIVRRAPVRPPRAADTSSASATSTASATSATSTASTPPTASPESADPLLDHLRASVGTKLPGGQTDGPRNKDGSKPTTSTSTQGTYNVTCQTQEMTQHDMANAFTLFDTSPNIFPGALVQGEPFMSQNNVKQITSGTSRDPHARKRAPLTIVVQGPTLSGGNHMFSSVQDPSRLENVDQAVRDILSKGVEQGVIDVSVDYAIASSEQQLDMDLGVAGSFGGFAGSSDLKYDRTDENNHLVVIYTQRFYSVVVDDFGGALNAFTADATDPPDPVLGTTQIGGGNPPLYIKQVDYGRQIMLEVTTSFSETNVKSVVEAAYAGADASVSATSKISHGDILENTEIRLRVRGGADKGVAGWTLLPASGDGGSGSDLFNQLKAQFATIKTEQFSSTTPAVPIGFTLSYLVDDNPASLLYTVDFVQKNCSSTAAAVHHQFQVDIEGYQAQGINGLDDHFEMSVDGRLIRGYDSPNGKNTWDNQGILTTPPDDGQPHLIQLRLFNNGGWATGGTIRLKRDGNVIYSIQIHGGTGAWTGKVWGKDLQIGTDGSCKATATDEPGAGYNIDYNENVNNCL